MTETWRNRLENLMTDRGHNFRSLSLKADLGETYVRDMLKRDRDPTIDKLRAIAQVLGTTVQYILEGSGDRDVGVMSVPLIAWVSAGAMARDDIGSEALGHITIGSLPSGDWIALRVGGDSMDRISPPDSIILVNRKDKQLVPNACYVISDPDGNATYKRYRPNPMRFEPVSTNPDNQPIFPEREPTVVGRVRRTTLDM